MTEALQLPGRVFPTEATPAKMFAVVLLLMSFGFKCPPKAKKAGSVTEKKKKS